MTLDAAITQTLDQLRSARFTAELQPGPQADANVETYQQVLDEFLDARHEAAR